LPLHIDPGLGGAAGIFLFWPVAIACAYALLMETRLAAQLSALCVLEVGLAFWLAPLPESLRPALAALGLLLIWPAVAMMLARSMQFADAAVEANLTDDRSQLYNTAGLLEYGSELFRQCRRTERPISIALMQCLDLDDAQRSLGRQAVTPLLAQAARDILTAASGDAIAARTEAGEFVMLLPDLSSERAKALLLKKLGSPPEVKTRQGSQKRAIPVTIAVSSARADTPNLEALYERVQYKIRKRRLQQALESQASSTTSPDQPAADKH
jgi:GGDEF domain-containing protein